MEDIAYVNINSTSTDEEKINAVIDFLSKSNAGYSLLYDKLFIPVGKEILFNEKLKATGLVTTSHGHTQDRPFFHLNEEGRIMIAEYDNFINYHKIKTIQTQKELNAIQEKENLELQKLRSENMLLTDQLTDFPKVKSDRKALFIIAMIELLVIIVGLILQLKGKS